MNDQDLCSLCDHWFDSDISQDERESFESHLQVCSKCQQRIELLKQLDWDLQAAYGLFGTSDLDETPLEPNVSFEQHQKRCEPTTAPICRESTSQRERTRWAYGLAMAATVFVVAGAGWLISQNHHEVTHTAETSNVAADLLPVETAHVANQPDSKEIISQVEVTIKAPAIAAPVYRTEKYTFVQIYPNFTWRDSDQTH